MTPQEKAIDLINQFKLILMDEDTECGNEILCTLIAKKCARIVVEEIIDFILFPGTNKKDDYDFYNDVEKEINKE